jgi:hypothetical protein
MLKSPEITNGKTRDCFWLGTGLSSQQWEPFFIGLSFHLLGTFFVSSSRSPVQSSSYEKKGNRFPFPELTIGCVIKLQLTKVIQRLSFSSGGMTNKLKHFDEWRMFLKNFNLKERQPNRSLKCKVLKHWLFNRKLQQKFQWQGVRGRIHKNSFSS